MSRLVVLLLLFSAVHSSAQTLPEERAAESALLARGQRGPVHVVRDFRRVGDLRVGIVRFDEALYLLVSHREGPGWRSQVQHLRDADPAQTSTHDLYVHLVSEARRLFLVHHSLRPRAPDASPCVCRGPGGTHRRQLYHVDAGHRLVPLISFDPGLGGAEWDEGAARLTVTQRRGPLRCPPGCEPAPSFAVISERVHHFEGGRLNLVSENDSRRY